MRILGDSTIDHRKIGESDYPIGRGQVLLDRISATKRLHAQNNQEEPGPFRSDSRILRFSDGQWWNPGLPSREGGSNAFQLREGADACPRPPVDSYFRNDRGHRRQTPPSLKRYRSDS